VATIYVVFAGLFPSFSSFFLSLSMLLRLLFLHSHFTFPTPLSCLFLSSFPASLFFFSTSNLFLPLHYFPPLFLISFHSLPFPLLSFDSLAFLYFPFKPILTAYLSSILHCHFVLSLCPFFHVLTYFHFFHPFFSLQSYALGPFSQHS
jgi:hypothetical protein